MGTFAMLQNTLWRGTHGYILPALNKKGIKCKEKHSLKKKERNHSQGLKVG
jgi:hypothetical protein